MKSLPALLLVACVVVAFPSARSARAYDDQHVFITNRGGNNVVELDEALTYVRAWFDGESFDGAQLASPNGMAFTPEGELFIADTANQRIVAFEGDGNYLRAFSTEERLGASVESIYFNGLGVLFATANPGLGVVARFDRSGESRGDVTRDDAFLNLGNVNLTSEGAVIVSDFSDRGHGLRELDEATGEVVRAFGQDLTLQEDVMIDGAGRVFVSHYLENEIVVFGPAPERSELYRFRAPESAPLDLERPTGIALTADCAILVASFETGGIFVFRHQGAEPPRFERVLRPGVEIPAEANLASVESIAIAGLGLPGGFDEFAVSVPSCDEQPAGDAGPPQGAVDSGQGVVDAGSVGDAGPLAPPGERGTACGCRVDGDERSQSAWWLLMGVLALGWRRRRASAG